MNRLARIERLLERTEDLRLADAPPEMDNREASAWLSGFHTFRDQINEILEEETNE